MKLQPLHIIAMLAAVIFAMFSIDTADVHTSTRSYRAYGCNPGLHALDSSLIEPVPELQEDNAVNHGITFPEEEAETGYHSPFLIPYSELNAPPVALSSSAMTELSPAQLPPLDAGMVNVTGGFDENMQTAGYRVKPMPGEFAIAVPYDPALLPQGFTEDDIQTFVYDRQYQRWVVIQRDSVNEAELLVCSRFRPWERGLPHTQNDMSNPQDVLAQAQDMMSMASQGEGVGESPLDFINAVLKTPEMPETSAYTPTSIKELKAADPLEGLTLMQPPTANNMGTANLSYPIEIPAGRQGMQPNLALTYSSGGGNGWLGVGWDISIPSITVETRWGVPRYDQSKESEVYVYEGEQLVSYDSVAGRFRDLPHRTNQWTDRNVLDQDGLEQFYPRKNEAFDSIVRHGSGPDSYWWTVTHKNGVTDYYGKYASDNSVNNSCVLRAGSSNLTGPIAHWALAESVDPFGNSVRYYYDIEQNAGISSSSVMGRQIYLRDIRYTCHPDEPSHYSVSFVRKTGRRDVVIAANRGFKEVTADVLCYAEVRYDDEVVRRYMFYTENRRESQYKTRLTDVVRIDDMSKFPNCDTDITYLENREFSGTRTHFDYYDAPRGGGIFGNERVVDLSGSNDNIHSFFVTNAFNIGNEGGASALGATKGKSWNIGGTATIGIGPVVPLTSLSVGGNFNYSRSKSEGLLTLIDLDGDGLADKVFKSGGGLYCRKRVANGDTSFHYGPAVPVVGATDFLTETSNTTTWGLQASAGCAYSGSWPKTTSTTSVYFSDVNGDGLPDLITDNGVLFNVTESGNDTVKFKEYYTMAGVDVSSGTDNPDIIVAHQGDCGGIIFDGSVNDSIACVTDWEFVERFPVKGLYEGKNIVDFADSLMNTGQFECVFNYDYYDSTGNGYEYANGYMDVYQKVVRCAPMSFDPDMETVKVWVAQYGGTVSISSGITLLMDNSESHAQSKRCDGVQYAIQICRGVYEDGQYKLRSYYPEEILIRDTIADSIHVRMDTTFDNVSVSEGDIVMFRLISGESRSFDKVTWEQEINYTGFSTNPGSAYDEYGMYVGLYNSQRDFCISGDKQFQSHKRNSRYEMTIRCLPLPYPSESAALVVFSSTNHIPTIDTFLLAGGQERTFTKNGFLSDSDYIHIYLVATNYGSFDVRPHIRYMFPDTVNNNPVTDTVDYYPPVEAFIRNYKQTRLDSLYHCLFGPLYRGWGQFAYNNNDTVGGVAIRDTVIRISRLVADMRAHPADQTQAGADTASIRAFQPCQDTYHPQEQSAMAQAFSSSGGYNPLSQSTGWVEMQPDSRHGAWVGYGNINYIVRDTMSNTRIVEYAADTSTADIVEYDHPVPVAPSGTEVKTIRKQNVTRLRNHSLSLSVPIVPISVGVSHSKGENTVLTDYMDLNGDRYPDIIGQVYVHYSTPWGGIGPMEPLASHVQTVSSSNTISEGANFGGSYSTPSRTTSNNPKNAKISFNGSGSVGVSLGGGSDNTAFTWMDVNGDGLPDKVNAVGGVALNTGYGFLPFENWGVTSVREGDSKNFGMNLGGNFNIGQASIGGGVGLNLSRNQTDKMLADFNGDGLPDKVVKSRTGIRVSYNMGAGRWSGWDTIPNIFHISYGKSYNESLDLSVTLGFTFWGILKVCVGVSGSPYGKSFSKDSVQLADINGDGYVDYVTSSSEDSMTVRYNQSGRTNLLCKVTNFTGSSIELDYNMPLACYEKPQRSWNLAGVWVRNNDTLCPVGGNRTHTSFEYADPHHDRYERMDYGYRVVTTREYDTDGGDTLYRYTVEEYENRIFNKRGKKTRDCVYDAAGKPYVEHLYDAIVYDYAGSMVSDDSCARADLYVASESVLTNYYEGQSAPQITSRIRYLYDNRRNVTEYTHFGDTTHHDEYFKAEISYVSGMPHNLVALPEQIEVTDYAGNLMQKRTASYHPTGKIQRLVRHNTSYVADYGFEYDQFGNLVWAKLPENHNGQRLEFNYQYDDTVHTYPVKVDNLSLGYSSTANYDCKIGKPTKTVDINGNAIKYSYDASGRTTVVLAPYEIDASKPYTIKMVYYPKNYGTINIFGTGTTQSYARTYHYDPQHPTDDITTTVIADGLGRLLQTKKDAEVDGYDTSLVTGRVIYDCFGRTVGQYHPFLESLSSYPSYNPYSNPNTLTVTEYDIMDRQTRVELPTHEVTRMEYGFGNIGGKTVFSTITTDALNNSVQVLKGTLGQQLKQVAPYGTTTLFDYDCLGQLKKSTDPDGFGTFYDYDMFGQMIYRKHPDAGNDNYVYDPTGNLIKHVNEMGETLEYSYNYNQLTDITCSHYPEYNVHYNYGTAADTFENAVGKVVFQEDASGWQTFKYGKLGELTENIRTFVLPYENGPYTFDMKFVYDSWNRIDSMFYPDGEVVVYGYNSGGMLSSMTGAKNGLPYKYIDSICYNEFELKAAMYYGNGTKTFYKYDALQRLSNLYSQTSANEPMQEIVYTYDSVSNIINITNYASTLLNGLGGKYGNIYTYNNLYRLVYSEGMWYGNHPVGYELEMEYMPNGRIVKKYLEADTYTQTPFSSNQSPVLYQNDYHYTSNNQPNTLTYIDNSPHQDFKWDVKGNLIFHYNGNVPFMRFLCWDEQNRLLGVKDDKFLSYYQYDANGDRIYKLTGEFARQNRNGEWRYSYLMNRPTLYASPYVVTNSKGYTKHYYAESERIASRIGGGGLLEIDMNDNQELLASHKERSINLFAEVMECLDAQAVVETSPLQFLYSWKHVVCPETDCYWYHPDHLGSSSWITYTDGSAVEHLHYMPWGEDFVRQRSTDWHAMYTFSAKEKDAETGYSYFGARYYSSDLSVWLSVDPMADKYPSLSPYVYCANNPIKLVDPNGEEIEITTETDSKGNQIINIHFTAILVNKSSQNYSKQEMLNIKKNIASAIKDNFTGDYGKGVMVNTTVDIICSGEERVENLETDLNRHTINIVDECTSNSFIAEAPVGSNYMNIRGDIGKGDNANNIRRTSSHEFGHLLGLHDISEKGNLMESGGTGKFLSADQIREAVNNYNSGQINNGIWQRDRSKSLGPENKLNRIFYSR